MKSSDAPIFGAALAARLQLDDLETRLLRVVQTPADGRGLNRVLLGLAEAFQMLAVEHGHSAVKDWHQVVRRLADRALAIEADFPQLGHDAEPGDLVAPRWIELQPSARTGARLEVLERLQGLLARAALAGMTEERPISSTWLKVWNRLLKRPRGKTAAQFEHVANHGDWTFQGIKNLADRVREPQLSRFLADCLSHVQVATPSATPAVPGAPLADEAGPSSERHEERKMASRAPVSEQLDDDEGSGTRGDGLLLPILYGRGIAATLVERLGSRGRYNVYPPQALTALCRRVRCAFDFPDQRRRDFAATFLANIAAPLPLERFLDISLRFNADLWLDLKLGTCSWSLRSLLKRRPRNFQGPDFPLLPHEIVDIPLEELALAHLHERAQSLPDALSLRDLVVKPGENVVNFLQAARDFLKECGDLAHQAYWSRATRGFGQHLRESLSDLFAVFGACDTVSTPMGILHYIQVDRQRFATAVRHAAARIGIRLCSSELRSADFGSRAALSQQEMALGLRHLDELARSFLDGLGRLRAPRELAMSFDAAMVAICMAVVTLTLSRGTRLERITVAQLHLHLEWVGIADKRASEDLDFRLIPAFAVLEHFLALHIRLLRKFKQRCSALGLTVDSSGIDQRLAMQGDQPAFFHLSWMGRCWRARDLKTADLMDVAEQIFGKRAANLGRHYGVSAFFAEGRDSSWIGMLTNHGRDEAEPYGPSRSVSRDSMQDELAGALDQLFPASILSIPPLRREPMLSKVIATMMQELPFAETTSASHDPRRIIGPASDRFTILSLAICSDVLVQINECRVPSISASLALALLVADGLRLTDLEIVLASQSALQASALTGVWSATWTRRERSNTICVPLVPLTATVLRMMGATPPKLCLPSALEATARYLRARYPVLPWPSSTEELLACFEQMCRRRWRHCVPGALELSASPMLDSATPSNHSLYRLGHRGGVSTAIPKAIRATVRTTRTQPGSQLAQVVQAIRDAGNTSKVDGEDERRFGNLEKALDRIGDVSDPCAAYLAIWQRILIKRQRGEIPGDPLDPASSVTYLRGTLRGLKALEFDGARGTPTADSWRAAAEEFWRECEGGTADDHHDEEDLRQLRVHWRHFLKAIAQAGHAAGDLRDLAEEAAGERVWEAKSPASAHLVLGQDWQSLRDGVPVRLRDIPLGPRRGKAAVELLGAGMRRMEIAAMRTARICADIDAAVVTTEGASHLKSIAARRPAALNASAAFELRAFKKELEASPGASDFLFSHSVDDLSDFETIADALKVELVIANGEASVRLHSGRGSVLMELHHPGWEEIVRSAYSGTLTEREVSGFVESIRERGLAHIGTALAQAGQAGVLTPSVHYISIWPAMRYVWLRHSLQAMEPSPALLKGLGRYDAFRQARSRSSEATFSPWDWLVGSLPVGGTRATRIASNARHCNPASETKPAIGNVAPRRLRDFSHVELVRLAMVVVLGENCEVVADGLRLDSAAQRLAQNWADSVNIESLCDGGESSRVRKNSLRKLVRSPACAILIDALWSAEASARADLLDDLSRFDGRHRIWCGSGDPVARIGRHLTCLPDKFSLQVRYGTSHAPADGWGKLVALKPRVVLDNSEEGRGPRPHFAIRVADSPKNLVTGSRWSAIARLALAIVQRANSSPTEEG